MPKRIAPGLLLLLALSALACDGGPPGANATNASANRATTATPYPRAGATPYASRNTNAAANVNANTGNSANANVPPNSDPPANPNANAAARNGNAAANVENSVDAFLASLPIGEAAFNTPERMRLGETANIELKLGGPQFAGNLAGRVTEPGRVETRAVKIGAVMEAKLVGSNFEVKELTPPEQAVAAGEPTEWEWQIKPTAEGRQRLNLTLSVVVEVDGRERRRKAETLKRDIDVEVDAGSRIGQFAYDHLEWIVPVVVVPLAGAVGLRLKRSRKREDGGAPPAG